jgi:hypothetical protein
MYSTVSDLPVVVLLLNIIFIVATCSVCRLPPSCFQQVHAYSQDFTVPKNTGSCCMNCRLKYWLSSGSPQWEKENEIWLHLKIIFKNGAESGRTCEGKGKLLNLNKWIRHYSTSIKHYDGGAITVPSIQATVHHSVQSGFSYKCTGEIITVATSLKRNVYTTVSVRLQGSTAVRIHIVVF